MAIQRVILVLRQLYTFYCNATSENDCTFMRLQLLPVYDAHLILRLYGEGYMAVLACGFSLDWRPVRMADLKLTKSWILAARCMRRLTVLGAAA